MKTMTCKQLGGACEQEFHAETFEEMAEQSKEHGMKMFQENDDAHIQAMNEMIVIMKDPKAMNKWFKKKKKEFKKLPRKNTN